MTTQMLLEKWNARRANYRSVEVLVDETQIDTNSAETRQLMRSRMPKELADKYYPKSGEPLTNVKTWRMLISGVKTRYETGKPSGKVLDRGSHIATYDGVESRFLAPAGNESKGVVFPTGFVFDKQHARSDEAFPNLPILWCFRGIAVSFGEIKPEQFKIRPERGIFDGVECVIADSPEMGEGLSHSFWFAPKWDYAIVRYTANILQQTRSQIDCHYAQDRDSGLWVPAKWTSMTFSGPTPTTTIESKVAKAVINPTFPDDLFFVQFPNGCVVSDLRPGKPKGRTGTYDYVVKEGGEERRILWSERNTSYSDLLASKSGETRERKVKESLFFSIQRYSGILAINAALVAIVVLFFLTRKKQQKP